MRSVLLLDNGSLRPGSTRALRQLAVALSNRIGETIFAVSLKHADKVDPAKLDGMPGHVLESFLRQQVALGVRDFVLLPLFFGLSSAFTESLPKTIARVRRAVGKFRVTLTPELYPLPAGEPRLVDILADHIRQFDEFDRMVQVILVDHGSPNRAVTAVRTHIATQLRNRFADSIEIGEAVMERREGPEYDFNGPLLENELQRIARIKPAQTIGLALLFLSPGRHAGPGGDIEFICATVCAEHPGFHVRLSPLVGEHPGLVDLLAARIAPFLTR